MDWINIKDRKPPNAVYVLVSVYDSRPKVNMSFIHIAERINDKWFNDYDKGELETKWGSPTHWMPLPDSPAQWVDSL